MKIQGSYVFEAPREQVWRALLDPEILARTLPGCEKLERVGENEFRGVLNVQVGPVKGQFQGSLLISDLKTAESYHMKLDGKGPAGFMTGEGDLTLSDPAGTGASTNLTYDLDSQVGGRIAGVGQRLLESSTKSITRLGLEGLAREIAAMPPLAPAVISPAETVIEEAQPPIIAPAPPPVHHLTQAEVAARVATDVARDMRPWLIGGALLLGVVVLVLMRACGS